MPNNAHFCVIPNVPCVCRLKLHYDFRWLSIERSGHQSKSGIIPLQAVVDTAFASHGSLSGNALASDPSAARLHSVSKYLQVNC